MAIKTAPQLPHSVTPSDFEKAIHASPRVRALWEDITPLARNEWVCWVISGKKMETRDVRIKKAISKMRGGMRRPCCWAGCMHRIDKKLSPSQTRVLSRGSKERGTADQHRARGSISA